ncbi:MAG: UPF0280 family protein, partial [Desulfatitalea sp.]|nr:UPF0280 family protein [Desulfatitalea sp.]NNK01975.1 UPF0280 family protein [Desulfatitalea sp.]
GGDIFLKCKTPITIAVYAGDSPLSLKIGLTVSPDDHIQAVCTSSGTVGHSLSLGRADAVCVASSNGALADAMATAIGNRVHRPDDIHEAIAWGRCVDGVMGILIIVGDRMGAWGRLEVVPLNAEKEKIG